MTYRLHVTEERSVACFSCPIVELALNGTKIVRINVYSTHIELENMKLIREASPFAGYIHTHNIPENILVLKTTSLEYLSDQVAIMLCFLTYVDFWQFDANFNKFMQCYMKRYQL